MSKAHRRRSCRPVTPEARLYTAIPSGFSRCGELKACPSVIRDPLYSVSGAPPPLSSARHPTLPCPLVAPGPRPPAAANPQVGLVSLSTTAKQDGRMGFEGCLSSAHAGKRSKSTLYHSRTGGVGAPGAAPRPGLRPVAGSRAATVAASEAGLTSTSTRGARWRRWARSRQKGWTGHGRC